MPSRPLPSALKSALSSAPKPAPKPLKPALKSALASTSKSNLHTQSPVRKPPDTKTPTATTNSQPTRLHAVQSAAISKTVPKTVPNSVVSRPTPSGSKPQQAAPPRLHLPPGKPTHTALSVRSKTLTALHTQLLSNYVRLPPSRRSLLASEVATRQEFEIHAKSSKKVGTAESEEDGERVGTVDEIEGWKKERKGKVREMKILECLESPEWMQRYLMTEEERRKYDYLSEIPTLDEGASGVREAKGSWEGRERECERCKKVFVVKNRKNMLQGEMDACTFHWGKLVSRQIDGQGETTHPYLLPLPYHSAMHCRSPRLQPPSALSSSRFRSIHTPPLSLLHDHRIPSGESSRDAADKGPTSVPVLPLVALDCELVHTVRGMSLARVTVIDASGEVVVDEWVRQDEGETIDLNTRFSGIESVEKLEKEAVLDLDGVKMMLEAVGVGRETIVVGHGAENDLRALRIVHERVVDTTQASLPSFHSLPSSLHPSGKASPPYRLALRDLALKYLHIAIQTGGGGGGVTNLGGEREEGDVGHSSLIDARTTLDLVKWRIRKDLKESGEIG
ncbi:hypothetical protein BT69DRAFT_1337362 [Atractiella rhizophila]|nr:hypothetical protein BT69DRAFT_1337362 [Atractiella rhizophila]